MALVLVPANAITAPINIPAGAKISVASIGVFKVNQVGTFTNFPSVDAQIADVAAGGAPYLSPTFAAAAQVTIDAYGGQPCWYSVGVDPAVSIDGRLGPFQVTPASVPATATLTQAQMLGGAIASTTAAAVVATTLTGTQLDAASTFTIGDSFELTLINSGAANTLTLGLGAGVTGDGNAADLVVALSTSKTFRFYKTAANTFRVFRV
jgi:hypothetical protein